MMALCSCGSGASSIKGGEMTPAGDTYAPDPTFSMEDGKGDGEGETGKVNESPRMNPGQLTCSALDDNNNYNYWKSLSESDQEGGKIFYKYRQNYAFNTFNRVNLTVKNGDNISIKLVDNNYTSKVDNLNKAYLFADTGKEEYDVEISFINKNGVSTSMTKTIKDGDEIDLENNDTHSNKIEIMFVIDATGSMGDEISYLKAEIDDVISKVSVENPGSTISLAIMMYRDTDDEYVTRYSDFTANIASQQNFLSKQSANGGGDYEEAVERALEEAVDKQWSTGESTKLLFLVADAPAHDSGVSRWNNAVKKASEKGIKIITVASSGIDKKTEYFFRSQSILTGGQYVYLTNDSGIGNSHIEPTIEDKLVVEYLNDCLIRLISGYYTGTFRDPVYYGNVIGQK